MSLLISTFRICRRGLSMLGAGRAVRTPTALISASRIVFSRRHKSRARDVVLQNTFGRWDRGQRSGFVAEDIDMVERSHNPGSREWSLRPVNPDIRRKRYDKELRGLAVDRLWRCSARHKFAVPL